MKRKPPPTPIHEAMRRARMEAGLSERELARRAGTYQALVSRYELGQTVPNIYTAMDLADALGVSLEVYLGLRDPP